MQTWLVVMRSPFRLVREIGVKASLAFHLLIGGMILSSLAHPLAILLVAHALHDLLGDRPLTTNENTLLAIDLFNVLGSYWIFRQMGMKRMTHQERRAIGWRQWALPVYWLALSLAAWRALPDLIARPFFWAKTPHIPAAQDMEEEETGAGSGNRTRAFSLGSSNQINLYMHIIAKQPFSQLYRINGLRGGCKTKKPTGSLHLAFHLHGSS